MSNNNVGRSIYVRPRRHHGVRSTPSIDFDRHLYRQDIAASKAHADMLAKQGIITADDAEKIAHGLDTILSEIEAGEFSFKRALEDIHMNVEAASPS